MSVPCGGNPTGNDKMGGWERGRNRIGRTDWNKQSQSDL